jgi:hypothetical protein
LRYPYRCRIAGHDEANRHLRLNAPIPSAQSGCGNVGPHAAVQGEGRS